jgi:hypothetical protein
MMPDEPSDEIADLKAEISGLKVQISLAVSSIGIALSQTLVELDDGRRTLMIVQKKTQNLLEHLRENDAHEAASIFASFSQALSNPKFFPQSANNLTNSSPRLEDFPQEERDILETVMRSTGKSLDELDVPTILKQARALDQK